MFCYIILNSLDQNWGRNVAVRGLQSGLQSSVFQSLGPMSKVFAVLTKRRKLARTNEEILHDRLSTMFFCESNNLCQQRLFGDFWPTLFEAYLIGSEASLLDKVSHGPKELDNRALGIQPVGQTIFRDDRRSAVLGVKTLDTCDNLFFGGHGVTHTLSYTVS